MSSSHERDRQAFQNVPAPEVPRRIRASGQPNGNTRRHPAIREIHKNAWLKRLAAGENKGTSFIKKAEKFWVVFCVHDDVEAFLEFYTEPKMGAIHKPVSACSINSCLHVSPSIMGQDNEYEFAVTLPTQVIRLIASNWEQMIEWVESLQGKLREMNILSPKDNLYSKLPESHGNTSCHNFLRSHYGAGLVTTRDPNSPLPPTPNSYIPPVAGAEVSRQLPNAVRGDRATEEAPPPVENAAEDPQTVNQVSASSRQKNQTETTTQSQATVQPKFRSNDSASSSRPLQEPTVIETTTDSTQAQSSVLTVVCPTSEVGGSQEGVRLVNGADLVENLLNLNVEDEVLQQTSTQAVALVVSNGSSASNTSVVQVTFDDVNTITPCRLSSNVSQNGNNNHPLVSVTVLSSPAPTTTGVTPLLPQPSSLTSSSPSATTKSNALLSSHQSATSKSVNTRSQINVTTTPTTLERQNSDSLESQRSRSRENIYEHLFIPSSVVNAAVAALKPSVQTCSNNENVDSNSAVSNQIRAEDTTPPAVPRRNNPHSKRLHKGSTSNSTQRSSSLSRIEQQDINTSSSGSRNHHNHGGNSSNQGHQRYRTRHADVVRPFESCSPSPDPASTYFTQTSSQECRPMEAMIGVRSGEYRIRRDDVVVVGSSTQLNGESEQVHGGSIQTGGATNLPLKEQQVMRLKSEIHHPGGVRIVLRKKDCVNSIAFVDYLGGVWIAGWKQQQHPVLYYAFHVGDQVLKIAGVTVQTSAEAYRAIKMVSSMQVEFIIRRLPYGRVFVLKRKKEGEPLGLVSEGNSGEIGEVVSNGLAASHGLPSNGLAADGQSTCNWFLTEINNRPLSLMAREIEVRERLNAVGKEISILVQPSDLVKYLRKQLKTMKSFKEYLVV